MSPIDAEPFGWVSEAGVFQRRMGDRPGAGWRAVYLWAPAKPAAASQVAEIDRLRQDCAQAYQVIGAAMFGEPCRYTQADVERALDNLSAASNGDPRPHDDLLPWPRGAATSVPSGDPDDDAEWLRALAHCNDDFDGRAKERLLSIAQRLEPADRAQRDELPPLPEPQELTDEWTGKKLWTYYSAEQMREYAALARKGC